MSVDDVTLSSPPSPATNSTSSSLVLRVQAQEPAAWRELADLYGPLIYNWARHANLQAQDAADIVQETFGAIFGSIARFRRDRPGDSFLAWLRTIARNKIRDRLRQIQGGEQPLGGTDGQNRLAQLPDVLSDSGMDAAEANAQDLRITSIESCEVLEPVAARSMLHRAIPLIRASVEPTTWQAFWLAVADGVPSSEVAQQLGVSVQSVYDAKYRVRKRIRELLDDLLE